MAGRRGKSNRSEKIHPKHRSELIERRASARFDPSLHPPRTPEKESNPPCPSAARRRQEKAQKRKNSDSPHG
jgi:hypothetical protein